MDKLFTRCASCGRTVGVTTKQAKGLAADHQFTMYYKVSHGPGKTAFLCPGSSKRVHKTEVQNERR